MRIEVDFGSAQTGVGYRFYDVDAAWIGARVTTGVIAANYPGGYAAIVTPPPGAVAVYWDCDAAGVNARADLDESCPTVVCPASDTPTVQDVALDLLRYVGITGFTKVENANALNRPGIDDDDVRRAISAINSALQTIQKHGPQSLKEGERAVFLNAPTPITVDVAHGLTSIAAAFPTWAAGCSVLLEGDADLNRIVSVNGTTGELLRSYQGATGTSLGTIYADSLALPADVTTVLEPVAITENGAQRRLRYFEDRGEFSRFSRLSYDGNGGKHGYDTYGPAKLAGRPAIYYVERLIGGRLNLRINPMPAQLANITFQAKLAAERVTAAALAIDGDDDPGVTFCSVGPGDVESLLLPIARWRFFVHPALKNNESRQSVKMEYDAVMMDLRNGSVFETAVGSTRACYI